MTIPLSPMDYYFFRRSLYTIQFVFEYQGHIDVDKFKSDLKATIRAIPAVGARIKILSDREIVFKTGFSIPVRVCTLSEEPGPLISSEKYLDAVQNIEGDPLVKVLITRTPTRSFVGFSFSHMVGDGASFFIFLDTLSKFSLSKDLTSAVSNQRKLLQIPDPIDNSSDNLFESTGYTIPRPPNPSAFTNELLEYPSKYLEDLKSKSREQGMLLSNNDILMADLAKRFHASIPSHEDNFIIRCPVDYRKIYNLPPGFFGNAVRDAVAIFHKDEVHDLSLSQVALRIRKTIQSIDKESVLASLKALDSLRIKRGIKAFEDVGCPGLLVSNLSKFPFAEIDFGLGSPIGFHHASLNPRLALILPSTNGLKVRFKRPLPEIYENADAQHPH